MSRTLIPLAIIGGAAALASCAPVPEPGPETIAGLDTSDQCFFTRTVNGFSDAPDAPDGDERIFVDTGPNEKFVLEPVGTCFDIDFARRIAIDERSGSSLCTGETTNIVVPSSTMGPQRCLVRVVGRVAD
ncbi:MAG: hypothetical protein CL808_07535 [Citromicrobium sp.]|nr:hypothetical protein [Citromicrobium sp.]